MNQNINIKYDEIQEKSKERQEQFQKRNTYLYLIYKDDVWMFLEEDYFKKFPSEHDLLTKRMKKYWRVAKKCNEQYYQDRNYIKQQTYQFKKQKKIEYLAQFRATVDAELSKIVNS